MFSIFFMMIFSYFLYITEPLQKLRVRFGTCKFDLSPPVILYYWSFQGDTSVVVLSFYVLVFKIVLCCWRLMYVFYIFS